MYLTNSESLAEDVLWGLQKLERGFHKADTRWCLSLAQLSSLMYPHAPNCKDPLSTTAGTWSPSPCLLSPDPFLSLLLSR